MNVLTLGGATQDSIIDYDDPETLNLHSTHGTQSYLLLEEGKKIEVNHLQTATGGGATNSAFCFKKIGFDVSALFKIGCDPQGDSIVALCQDAAIDTRHCVQTDKMATACSFIIPSLHGDRTVFAYRGANGCLTEQDIPFAELAQFDLLYITSLSGESAKLLPMITSAAQENGVRVAINPGISQLQAGAAFIAESLQAVELLMLNSAEAKQLMVTLMRAQLGKHEQLQPRGLHAEQTYPAPELIARPIRHEDIKFNLYEFFERVLALGPKTVVVTNGEEGVYVAHAGKVYFHPSLAAKPVNTVGAGDAFSASFVAAIQLNHPVEDAIRWGVVNSKSVVQVQDAKSGLLHRAEIVAQVADVDRDQLQVFSLTKP